MAVAASTAAPALSVNHAFMLAANSGLPPSDAPPHVSSIDKAAALLAATSGGLPAPPVPTAGDTATMLAMAGGQPSAADTATSQDISALLASMSAPAAQMPADAGPQDIEADIVAALAAAQSGNDVSSVLLLGNSAGGGGGVPGAGAGVGV
jgi:hypothetical protein